MLKLKYILNDMVEYAYKDDPRLPQYKKFYVEYLKKRLKTKLGDYRWEGHHIRVFTEGVEDVQIMLTSIHELSHHIDYVQRKESHHDKRFYAIYRRLLYAALDMRIIDKYEYMGIVKTTSDASKVMKMLQAYHPRYTDYKKNMIRIVVSRAYEIKEDLKKEGYSYNAYKKTWEKELTEKEYDEREKEFLDRLGAEYETENATKIKF